MVNLKNPNFVPSDSISDTVGPHDELADAGFLVLRDDATRFREVLKALGCRNDSPGNPQGNGGIVRGNVVTDCLEIASGAAGPTLFGPRSDHFNDLVVGY